VISEHVSIKNVDAANILAQEIVATSFSLSPRMFRWHRFYIQKPGKPLGH
jgi:hypothetical protein